MTQRLRFGEDFELHPATYQLDRAGHALKLERIPMEILLLLTERPGELISREQIIERTWGKGHHLDADNSINGAIRKIRQVLRDDPEHPRFIQTITGRGYRFMAPVVAVEEPPATGTDAAPQDRRRVWLTAGVSLAILLGAVAWLGVRASQSSPQRVMVAVLPFQNLTGDAAQEYFSDGLTEEMIAQLGNVDTQRLQVIARTSVMHYKNRDAPLTQIARELDVQYVLEGSVRRDGNAVRVTAQLIQTNDQTHIWAQQYDRELKDLLTLQGEIARRIASEIQSALGVDESGDGRLPAPAAQNYEAYDLYLKALHFFNQRTVSGFERAIGFLEQATAKDPKYARAHALLADSYELLFLYGGRVELVPKARAAALKALELDPGSAEAHTALALIVQNHDYDWQTAEREFRQAIELNPNYATAHHWYAEHLMCRGRFDEALRESERALQLDPLSLIIATDHGAIQYSARQYDRAIETLRSVLDRDPDFPRAHIIQAAYVGNGMLAEALADVESERQHGRVPEPAYWATLAYFHSRSGDTTQARRAFDELLRYRRRHPVAPLLLAGAFLSVGEHDSAFAWLERVYAEGHSGLTALKVAPEWDPLRGDPRFQSLLRRVGLDR